MIDLLAHQGGWDELLVFAVPIAIAIFGVRYAERRARRRQAEEADESERAPDHAG